MRKLLIYIIHGGIDGAGKRLSGFLHRQEAARGICEGTDGAAYEMPELYRSVCINEIESKGWALTPSKYIEFIDHDLDIDYEKEMVRIQSEMKRL